MGMEMKLQFKLSQQLVMTPQLVQAIRLLQLSRLELIDEIRKELDANPVLADDDIDPRGTRDAAEREAPAAQEERVDRMEDRIRSANGDQQKTDEKNVREIDWEQFLENR